MATIEKRLDALEQRSHGPGETVVVYKNDWRVESTPEQDQTKIAAAQAALGPDDTLLVIEFVDQWREDLPVA